MSRPLPRPTCTRVRRGAPTVAATSAPATTFLPDGSNAGQGPNAFMVGTGNSIKMDCASCHDPHGSANYRILKAVVNGNNVGGYTPTADSGRIPTPTASSPRSRRAGRSTASVCTRRIRPTSPTTPTPDVRQGLRHADATLADPATGINDDKGMSGWCSGCHSTYLGQLETVSINGATDYASFASTYNAGDGGGLAVRHRHPINVPLTNYKGPDKDSDGHRQLIRSAAGSRHHGAGRSGPTRIRTGSSV